MTLPKAYRCNRMATESQAADPRSVSSVRAMYDVTQFRKLNVTR